LLTGDDPYQNLGGLGLAVRSLDGTTPELWISNLRNPSQAKAQTASSFLRSEVRSRYWNPQWIEGIMKEGYSGGREISNTVEYLWGWDVMVPEMIDDAMWNEFKAVYVDDKYNLGLKGWFNENNPHAYQSMVGRMLETIRKGYWQASPQTRAELAAAYQESVRIYGMAGAAHLETPEMENYMQMIISQPDYTAKTPKTSETPDTQAIAATSQADVTRPDSEVRESEPPASKDKAFEVIPRKEPEPMTNPLKFTILFVLAGAGLLLLGRYLVRRRGGLGA